MDHVNRFILTTKLLDQLVAHAEQSKPYESVSLIAGKIVADKAIAELIFSPENVEKSRVAFTVDALTLLDIYKEIESQGKILIGIYHTHPAPPKPSGIDLDYMEVNSCIWLISSFTKPESPRGYFLTPSKELKEITIEVID